MKLHFIHDWSNWEKIVKDDGEPLVYKVYFNGERSPMLPYEQYILQSRECTICKKIEIRKIKLL